MSDQDPSLIVTIESVVGGDWAVWLSDTGWWWASRRRTLTTRELSDGCLQYLHADNPHELLERIRQQNSLSSEETRTRPGTRVNEDRHDS